MGLPILGNLPMVFDLGMFTHLVSYLLLRREDTLSKLEILIRGAFFLNLSSSLDRQIIPRRNKTNNKMMMKIMAKTANAVTSPINNHDCSSSEMQKLTCHLLRNVFNYNTLVYLRWFWVHYIPSLQTCSGFSTFPLNKSWEVRDSWPGPP